MTLNIEMHAPQWIWLCASCLLLFLTGIVHGTPRTGNWDLRMQFVTFLANAALLYWGGFFSP